jgi:uncharacterized membrane protein YbhN (UPF0104 family)
VLFTAAKYIDSWRWRFLLRGTVTPPQRALFGAFLIGNTINNLLPLRAGDVAKIQVLANRYGVSRAALAASVFVVEAALDAVVFALFLLAAFATGGLGGVPSLTPRTVGVLAVAALALFGGGVALARASGGRFEMRARSFVLLQHASTGFYALRSRRRAAAALALSLPAWLVEAGVFMLFGQAFGLELSYWNVGPYEALVAGVLVSAGVTETTALSFAVTVHLVTSAWIVGTGLIVFWAMRVRPREVFALR